MKSEIRTSQINNLLQKVADRKYGKYLARLVLTRVRGFREEPISFDFPVTAIIGPNGGGKTTALGAAACAYKSVWPRRFFAKSGKYDETMQDWQIEYEIIDRELNAKNAVTRTASFKRSRWNREAADREVLVFGVNRTVPANERPEMRHCAVERFTVPESDVSELAGAVGPSVARILSKDVTGFRRLRVERSGGIILLTGKTKSGEGYSEFHFGAGESSIIRMLVDIERAEDQSLILIEEIENGLHPVATTRLVEYLIEVAERKRVQVIFTTHSNEALSPLPAKAVWVASNDRLFQGKLDVASLRAITGQIETTAVVFVEDDFAKLWVEAILRQHTSFPIDNVQVHAMSGDGTAVAMNKYHNDNPAIQIPSVCIVDGDSLQVESATDRVFRLPGAAPEAHVFDTVVARWAEVGGKVAVAVLARFEENERVLKICQEVRRQNMDVHLLFAQVGDKLGLVPGRTVAQAFANIWSQIHTLDAKPLVDAVCGILPSESQLSS